MSYELFLFDLDDTLFDSRKTEKFAFTSTLGHFGLKDEDGIILKQYQELSMKLWADYSKGLITKEEVKVQRYHDLFKSLDKKFDPVEAAAHHIEAWVEHTYLLDGSVDVCKKLKEDGRKIGIVTNGFQETQGRRLEKSELNGLIDFLVVPEECGYSKPHSEIFDYSLKKANHSNKKTTLMVGDHLETDVLGAHKYNIKSMWLNHKRVENPFDFKPHYEIHDIRHLLEHI